MTSRFDKKMETWQFYFTEIVGEMEGQIYDPDTETYTDTTLTFEDRHGEYAARQILIEFYDSYKELIKFAAKQSGNKIKKIAKKYNMEFIKNKVEFINLIELLTHTALAEHGYDFETIEYEWEDWKECAIL